MRKYGKYFRLFGKYSIYCQHISNMAAHTKPKLLQNVMGASAGPLETSGFKENQPGGLGECLQYLKYFIRVPKPHH